jgi:twinkle protein
MNANQSKFMKKCSSLAKATNVPVVLCAHPNSSAAKGKKIDYYQISGTSDIPNLAEIVVQIIKEPTNDEGGVIADGMISILKNRYGEKNEDILLTFDKETHSLCEMKKDGGYDTISYNWKNEGKQSKFVTTNDSPF